jgi:hypothetical protein
MQRIDQIGAKRREASCPSGARMADAPQTRTEVRNRGRQEESSEEEIRKEEVTH